MTQNNHNRKKQVLVVGKVLICLAVSVTVTKTIHYYGSDRCAPASASSITRHRPCLPPRLGSKWYSITAALRSKLIVTGLCRYLPEVLLHALAHKPHCADAPSCRAGLRHPCSKMSQVAAHPGSGRPIRECFLHIRSTLLGKFEYY